MSKISDSELMMILERLELAKSVELPANQAKEIAYGFLIARMALREISKYGKIGPGYVARTTLDVIDSAHGEDKK